MVRKSVRGGKRRAARPRMLFTEDPKRPGTLVPIFSWRLRRGAVRQPGGGLLTIADAALMTGQSEVALSLSWQLAFDGWLSDEDLAGLRKGER